MNPRISVIIPVYNAEKYIWECLESVRIQTFRDFEVIIVNDGSKDNSAGVAAEFIAKYGLGHFRILNNENGGPSAARNAGLAAAEGEWVFFLDSDDWLQENALSTLVDCMERNPADLVIGGCQAYDQGTGETEVWSGFPCESGLMPQDLDKLYSFSFCWGRLYNKEIIDKNHLRFDERILYAEDNAWQFDYVSHIHAFAYTDEVIYNYRINRAGALTQRLVTPQMKYHVAEHMYSFYEKIDQELAADSLLKNPRLLSVTWGTLSTNVVNDILDKEYSRARAKIHSDLGRAVNRAFSPRSGKEKIFLLLWRRSFALLCVFVKIYYGNFDKLRRLRFVEKMSTRSK